MLVFFSHIGEIGVVRNLGLSKVLIGLWYIDQYAGVMAGANAGLIENCYVTDSELGPRAPIVAGGFLGINKGTILNCYTELSSDSYWFVKTAAGFVGHNTAHIGRCYAVVHENHNMRAADFIGPLVALNQGAIVSCYYLDLPENNVPDNGFGTPLITEQMKNQSSFIGWDFISETENGTDDIWYMPEGDYPRLFWELADTE